MINKVREILKVIAPTEYMKRPSEFPSIRYSFTYISPNEFADDDIKEIEYSMQVDIWENNPMNLDFLGERVKAMLKENNWDWEMEFDNFEKDIGIWQKVLRFNLIESEV